MKGLGEVGRDMALECPEMVVSGTGQILDCHLVWVEGNLDKSSFMEQWEQELNWGGLKGERGSGEETSTDNRGGCMKHPHENTQMEVSPTHPPTTSPTKNTR